MKTSLRSSSSCLVTQILNQKPSEWNRTPTESQQNIQSSELKIVIIFHDKRYPAAWKGCRASKLPEGQKWTGCPFSDLNFWPVSMHRCAKRTRHARNILLNDMQHMWVTAPRRGWVTPGQEPAKNTGPHQSRKNGGGHVDAHTCTLGSDSRRTALRSLACDSRTLQASFMT